MSYSLNSTSNKNFLKDRHCYCRKVLPELTILYKQTIADMKSKLALPTFTAPGIELYDEAEDNADYEETTDLDEIMSGS